MGYIHINFFLEKLNQNKMNKILISDCELICLKLKVIDFILSSV